MTGDESRIVSDYRTSLMAVEKMAEALSDLDPVNDAMYNLRGEIFEDLKAEGFISVDANGPDSQILIDAVIRHLLEMV